MAYIYLTEPGEPIAFGQSEPLIIDLRSGSRRLINLDFDSSGCLIGIEIDGASVTLPASLLASADK